MLDELIAIEEAELGYREGAGNITKYGAEYGLDGQPWCVMFQWWCAKRAGVPFPNTAHCNGVESYAKEQGRWVQHDFEVGDFVIFDYDKDGSRDHIGLVVETENGRVKTTIEGNYADAVARVNRRSDCSIIGAYRPKYTENPANAAEKGDSEATSDQPQVNDTPTAAAADVVCKLPNLRRGDYGEAVEALQILLRYHRHFGLSGSFIRCTDIPDGEFGPETEFCVESYTGKKEVDAEGWEKIIGGLG